MVLKRGIVDISNLLIPPEKHELATANYFADLGNNITFICPSNVPDNHKSE